MSEEKEVRLVESAKNDLVRLKDFLYNQAKSLKVLAKFDTEIRNALTEIGQAPHSCPYAFEGAKIRKKVKWQYVFFYLELPKVIFVMCV